MSASKPSILIVPGAFGLPEFYDDVVNGILAQGYDIRVLHLLSVGLKTGPREGAAPTMFDDAVLVAKESEKLVDKGKNVILVGHSYGGVPMSESTKGLGKVEREAQGKKGGIVGLAYMTSVVPGIGQSAMDIMGNVAPEYKLEYNADEAGWLYQSDIPRAAAITINDMPKELTEPLIRNMSCHSGISFMNALTYAGYKDIPVSYLICEDDLCISPKIQREGIEMIEKASGRKVEISSINAGHCPIVSQPQKVIDWVLDVAGKA